MSLRGQAAWVRALGVAATAVGVALTLAANAHAEPSQTRPTLTLDDGGLPLVSLTNAVPSEADSACALVTYSGNEPARVRLYGATSGTGLDRYLDVTITRGRFTGSVSRSCEGFEPDGNDFIGEGAGVIYRGTLAGFPDDAGSAMADPTPDAPRKWSGGESHAYRVAVVLAGGDEAQGLEATQSFVWGADGRTAVSTGTWWANAPTYVVPETATQLGEDEPPPAPFDPESTLREDLANKADAAARGLVDTLKRATAVVAKRAVFPAALLVVLAGFLLIQDRIDRRDPKLALAPVYPDPDLLFLPPDSAKETA